MAARFHPLEARLARDVKALDDRLGGGASGNEDALRADILRDARALDRYLAAGGALSRSVTALSTRLDGGEGALLFEILSTASRLSSATERLRGRDPRGACEAAARTSEDLSLAACSLGGRPDLAEAWKAGARTFEAHTRDLADALESKGFREAGALKRMLNAAHSLVGSRAGSAEERAIAAKAAVANALWCALALLRLRKALGAAPEAPRAYPRILARIAVRL